MKKYLIIVNPNSGNYIGDAKTQELYEYFRARSAGVEVFKTTAPGSAVKYCRENHSFYDCIIAVGGDGIINEVAQLAKITSFNLGVIPAGTANVLAKEFNIPEKKTISAADIILKNNFKPIDVWKADDTVFLLFLSGGIDSAAVENINLKLKKITGKFSYFYETLKQFILFNIPDYSIKINGNIINTKQFYIINIKKYAGHFIINPEAQYSDGKIEMLYLKKYGRFTFLLFAANFLLSRDVTKLSFVDIMKSDSFLITAEKKNNAPIEFDGEKGLYAPLQITKLQNKIFLAVC